jgi:hypothetical protein
MGRAWSTKTSAILTMSMVVDPNTGKNSQVKTPLNLESSQGESRIAYESVGLSKNSLVISGEFTNTEIRA